MTSGNIFGILRKYKLRLNVAKCYFGVGSGKFFVLYGYPPHN